MKVFCTASLQFQFDFVIFWCNNFGARAACKMLMKLTIGKCRKDWMIKNQSRKNAKIFCNFYYSLVSMEDVYRIKTAFALVTLID